MKKYIPPAMMIIGFILLLGVVGDIQWETGNYITVRGIISALLFCAGAIWQYCREKETEKWDY